ncbi:MAG: thermonuclease family protein [Nitrospiraceae bacterium]|nr:thermonuclease family protein [Nitrospiraceae bacterium]
MAIRSKSCMITRPNAFVSVASTVQRRAKPTVNAPNQATSVRVFGEKVTLRTFGKDRYRRTIADVLLPDGTNLNHPLVKEGMCWWYRKHAPGNAVLEDLEADAREKRTGL